MTKDNGIHNAIYEELYLSYTQAGRVVPTTLNVVSESLERTLGFSDVEEVHETFRRARDMADIPTQRVLKEALTNHRAESYKENVAHNAIEYRDPTAAWLPKNPVMRRINETEAVKNYLIACGGKAYWQLCDAKSKGPDAYGAFMANVKAIVARLYAKYWKSIPLAKGYPANATTPLSLIPATVENFREMFAKENVKYA